MPMDVRKRTSNDIQNNTGYTENKIFSNANATKNKDNVMNSCAPEGVAVPVLVLVIPVVLLLS